MTNRPDGLPMVVITLPAEETRLPQFLDLAQVKIVDEQGFSYSPATVRIIRDSGRFPEPSSENPVSDDWTDHSIACVAAFVAGLLRDGPIAANDGGRLDRDHLVTVLATAKRAREAATAPAETMAAPADPHLTPEEHYQLAQQCLRDYEQRVVRDVAEHRLGDYSQLLAAAQVHATLGRPPAPKPLIPGQIPGRAREYGIDRIAGRGSIVQGTALADARVGSKVQVRL